MQVEKQMKSKLINFKVTDYEYTKLLSRARKFFGGNLSELLRTSGLNYEHNPEEVSYVKIEVPEGMSNEEFGRAVEEELRGKLN